MIQVKKGVTNGNGYTLTVKEKEGIKDMTREQSGNITNNSLTGLYVNTDSKEDILPLLPWSETIPENCRTKRPEGTST